MPKQQSIPSDRMVQVIDLFQRFGYKSLSMLDIATELAISKKTLYSYVENKEALISQTINAVRDGYRAKYKKIQQQNLSKKARYDLWFQLLVAFHQDFSIYARQDLSDYYPIAKSEFLTFHQELLHQFWLDLTIKQNMMTKYVVLAIDLQIDKIIHEQLQINGKGNSELIEAAMEYNWVALEQYLQE